MVRVPDTESFSVLLGEAVAETPPLPFSDLADRDIDALVVRCRQALQSLRRDSLSRDMGAAEDALAAIETVKGTLGELLRVAPIEKRAKIESLIERG